MATITQHDSHLPLGAGALIGETFSILFKNFIPPVVIVAFLPTLLSTLVGGLLAGFSYTLGNSPVPNGGVVSNPVVAGIATPLVQTVFYVIGTALLVQLAYDAKLGGRSMQYGRYFSKAVSVVVPLFVLSIVSSIAYMLGMVLLIVPGGLWIYAVFSVMAPAVAIEDVGFRGGLGRSAELTKGYRWPILGTLLLFMIILIVVGLVSVFFAGGALMSLNLILGGVLVFTVISALGSGLVGIVTALIYARLREIKEGVSVDQIASVFD